MATETIRTPVTMTDGRVVEFTTKQKLAKTSAISDDGIISLVLDFRNGQTRTFTMPASLVNTFAAHGAEQKLGDAIAGEPDLDDAILGVDELITRLEAGDWSAAKKEGGNAGASVLLKALFEVRGAITPEAQTKIREWLTAKTQSEKLALRKLDVIAPVVARLEAEKASKSKNPVDAGSLFGELDSLGENVDETAPTDVPPGRSRKSAEG